MPAISTCQLLNADLVIRWEDGLKGRYHPLWLRDNCPCVQCRHPGSGQRLLETATIPAATHPAAYRPETDGDLAVDWQPEGHQSRYPAALLRAYAQEAAAPEYVPIAWEGSFDTALVEMAYDDLGQDKALHRWLTNLPVYGFALLRQCPLQEGLVEEVAQHFGYVRQTNYGRIFDVRSVSDPNNLAYTGLALSPHTDNPYRDPVPGLQLLHCLVSSAAGGESILVDGLAVTNDLRQHHPEFFDLLSNHPVRFHFSDQETELTATAPLIALDHQGQFAGVRFNNRSIAPFRLPADQMAPFYRAYRTFTQRLESPQFQIRMRLAPGDLMLFDNTRLLHGRTAFSGAGQRHLQGCYVDPDGLYSRLGVLARQHA
ncbi:MAG: DUF971 domain-containing protein [Candidatus Latescibacteria bacterium]|nr:DUF971 domain-containing protein [Candidatus Latescibacterota bacterium]